MPDSVRNQIISANFDNDLLQIEVVDWLWEASVWSLCAWYKPKQIATNIEKETNSCRRNYGQEQTNSRKADGALYILSLEEVPNYSIDHRYWYNIIEFLGHILRELQLLAGPHCTLESLRYLHYVYRDIHC